ncbi:MAG: aldose epimerase family protein [Cyclobacteriaceae bacterium]|nr:galactose-1-epimerase [Cytophagales bacterium]HNP76839.1 aldose epimerase family protein [Cyclobacteriaceae bacterium]HQQ82084.1 aldose epimerase family protein [Cyclobacteriaceae bacterium]
MNRLLFMLALGLFVSCSPAKKESSMAAVADSVSTGLKVYTLQNSKGMRMTVTNFGGKIMSLFVPDRHGKFEDVVLGYDSANQYPAGNPYFGAMIGRFGNRIAAGQFTLNGKSYQLATNNGKNALHGGPTGFHNRVWSVQPQGPGKLMMSYVSADGEEGYPGTLTLNVTYTLTDQNELEISYEATANQPTILNPTHHSFFNLAGAGNGDILGHQLELMAEQFLPVDEGLIPTGTLTSVDKTPFDFRQPHTIGERIGQNDGQLAAGKGYDHCWVLKKNAGAFELAARVTEPVSGRVMEVWTTEPGLQFYSGNFLTGKDIGKGGKAYNFRTAFCLEAEHFPDSPNRPEFPSTVLNPGEKYQQKTVYRFSAR